MGLSCKFSLKPIHWFIHRLSQLYPSLVSLVSRWSWPKNFVLPMVWWAATGSSPLSGLDLLNRVATPWLDPVLDSSHPIVLWNGVNFVGCTSQLAKNPAFITVTQVYHMNGPFAFLSLTPLPFKPWRLRLLELWDDGIIHGQPAWNFLIRIKVQFDGITIFRHTYVYGF